MEKILSHIGRNWGWYLIGLYFVCAFTKWGYWEQMLDNIKELGTFTPIEWLYFIGLVIAIVVVMFALFMLLCYFLGEFETDEIEK